MGEGTRSAEVSATPITLPDAPVSLSATPQNTQVNLTWLPPPSDGGSTITSYKVYEGTTSGGETLLARARLEHLVHGHRADQRHQVLLRGHGRQRGRGRRACRRGLGHAGHLPGRPDGLTATPGNSQVSLSWTAPANNGGSAVTSYKVYEGTTSGGETFLANSAPRPPTWPTG